MTTPPEPCPICDRPQGEIHVTGCEIETCARCGYQRIGCECGPVRQIYPRIPWGGEHHAAQFARAFGWYSKWVTGKGHVQCEASDPAAAPDLNRVLGFSVARWDPSTASWFLPKDPKPLGKL